MRACVQASQCTCTLLLAGLRPPILPTEGLAHAITSSATITPSIRLHCQQRVLLLPHPVIQCNHHTPADTPKIGHDHFAALEPCACRHLETSPTCPEAPSKKQPQPTHAPRLRTLAIKAFPLSCSASPAVRACLSSGLRGTCQKAGGSSRAAHQRVGRGALDFLL